MSSKNPMNSKHLSDEQQKNNSDKRLGERFKVLCKVYNHRHIASGYTVNISHYGLSLWVKRDLYVHDDVFTFYIEPPVDLDIALFCVNLKAVWINVNVSEIFNVLGCQFFSLNAEGKIRINRFLEVFQNYSFNKR